MITTDTDVARAPASRVSVEGGAESSFRLYTYTHHHRGSESYPFVRERETGRAREKREDRCVRSTDNGEQGRLVKRRRRRGRDPITCTNREPDRNRFLAPVSPFILPVHISLLPSLRSRPPISQVSSKRLENFRYDSLISELGRRRLHATRRFVYLKFLCTAPRFIAGALTLEFVEPGIVLHHSRYTYYRHSLLEFLSTSYILCLVVTVDPVVPV